MADVILVVELLHIVGQAFGIARFARRAAQYPAFLGQRGALRQAGDEKCLAVALHGEQPRQRLAQRLAALEAKHQGGITPGSVADAEVFDPAWQLLALDPVVNTLGHRQLLQLATGVVDQALVQACVRRTFLEQCRQVLPQGLAQVGRKVAG
ncbi:hypothetical protein D3C72_1612050 [compost metagenome]